jgi:hypothetical protein
MNEPSMTQSAPFPVALKSLIDRLTYKEGWRFTLEDIDRGQGSQGLTLNITITCQDSYSDTPRLRRVAHYMIVPAAAYDERAWTRWLLDQCLLVEQHECCEFFRIDGKRPFSPNHGPGRNPYSILEKGTFRDAAVMYTGEQRNPERKDD